MLKVFRNLLNRYFFDEEAVVITLLLGLVLLVIMVFGSIFIPVLAAFVFAFLLQGVVAWLERRRIPHLLAVLLVFVAFLASFAFILLGLLPLIWKQVTIFYDELPVMLQQGQSMLMRLPEKYPSFISQEQITMWVNAAQGQLGQAGRWVIQFSLSQLVNFVSLMIYLILVPLLVFFFLKDRLILKEWILNMLPKNRRMLVQIGNEMNEQITNYMRGKIFEIVIVGFVTYLCFILFNLHFAALLAILVGLSVVVPYVGAAVVTIPVALIGFFQWGWSHNFVIMMIVYGVIQAIDGNVLVPLLFSEAVNLHPVAIVVAILIFGGAWGIWGIFFAIPLATFCKAVINAWPRYEPPSDKIAR